MTDDHREHPRTATTIFGVAMVVGLMALGLAVAHFGWWPQ